MADHPVACLLHVLVAATLTGYLLAEEPPWAAALAGGLALRSIYGAVKSMGDPGSSCTRTKFFLLVCLCLLLPCLAAAVPLTASPDSPLLVLEWDPSLHTIVCSWLNVVLFALALPFLALLRSLRTELPCWLVVSLAWLAAAAGVAATGYLLHEGGDALRSGLAAAGTLLVVALCSLCIGLHAGRKELSLLFLRWAATVLFLGCLGAAVAGHALVDGSSERLLQQLQAVATVAAAASLVPLVAVYYLSYKKRALDFGYTKHAATATSVCRILVKVFSLLALCCSLAFGATIHAPVLSHMLSFLCLMASLAAAHFALAYVRYKEAPLTRLESMDGGSVALCILAAVVVAGEIAHVVLCFLWWPSLPALSLGLLCLSAHCLQLLAVYLVDCLRPVLRPLCLPVGLLLSAAASSLMLYGELTQFFPGQSRDPTIWLAVSLAAASATQLLAVPVVECFKREVAEEKRCGVERATVFRATVIQRLMDRRWEKEREAESAAATAARKAEALAKKKAAKAAPAAAAAGAAPAEHAAVHAKPAAAVEEETSTATAVEEKTSTATAVEEDAAPAAAVAAPATINDNNSDGDSGCSVKSAESAAAPAAEKKAAPVAAPIPRPRSSHNIKQMVVEAVVHQSDDQQ